MLSHYVVLELTLPKNDLLRMSLLLVLTIARGGSYLVEQPSSSVLRWYNRFKELDLHSSAALPHLRELSGHDLGFTMVAVSYGPPANSPFWKVV